MKNNPIQLFNKWYAEADKKVKKLPERAALATADSNGIPSCRMVLLKGFDNKGFVFYTNYNSPKARQMDENPFAAMTFHWVETGKQVRVEGSVEKVSTQESDVYFSSRPRQSQLGAWASKQSAELFSRFTLLRKVAVKAMEFANREVPRPDFWGGYRIKPQRIEFWEEQKFRLHNRFLYKKTKQGQWEMHRLSP